MESTGADTPAPDSPPAPRAGEAPLQQEEAHPHNFGAQKEQHRLIRNDPDYDDWEYGTEPLPQEAWPTPTADAGPP
ncbi:MAG: hypothetical protein ACO3B3_09345 [Cyanobium sp.]